MHNFVRVVFAKKNLNLSRMATLKIRLDPLNPTKTTSPISTFPITSIFSNIRTLIFLGYGTQKDGVEKGITQRIINATAQSLQELVLPSSLADCLTPGLTSLQSLCLTSQNYYLEQPRADLKAVANYTALRKLSSTFSAGTPFVTNLPSLKLFPYLEELDTRLVAETNELVDLSRVCSTVASLAPSVKMLHTGPISRRNDEFKAILASIKSSSGPVRELILNTTFGETPCIALLKENLGITTSVTLLEYIGHIPRYFIEIITKHTPSSHVGSIPPLFAAEFLVEREALHQSADAIATALWGNLMQHHADTEPDLINDIILFQLQCPERVSGKLQSYMENGIAAYIYSGACHPEIVDLLIQAKYAPTHHKTFGHKILSQYILRKDWYHRALEKNLFDNESKPGELAVNLFHELLIARAEYDNDDPIFDSPAAIISRARQFGYSPSAKSLEIVGNGFTTVLHPPRARLFIFDDVEFLIRLIIAGADPTVTASTGENLLNHLCTTEMVPRSGGAELVELVEMCRYAELSFLTPNSRTGKRVPWTKHSFYAVSSFAELGLFTEEELADLEASRRSKAT